VNNAILEMKALLNLDFSASFMVVPPDANAAIDRAKLASLSPEIIYSEAAQTFGSLQYSKLRLAAARRRVSAIRGALLPQLSASGQLATYYTSNARNAIITGYQSGSVANTYVDVNGTQTPVYQSQPVFTTSPIAYGSQFDRNFQQTVALNLTVPLFNAWQGQYSLRRARLAVQGQEIGQDQAEQRLRQEVYKVYEEARNAVQTLAAAQRSLEAARRAYDFASQRYSAGLANTVEFLNMQASRVAAEARFLSAKYDLLFKLKMIDYYMGKPLIL
jgi:outer membrane protein